MADWVLVYRDNYAGNLLIFWKKGKAGYTANIDKAHRFTKEEAFKQHRARDTDIPWPAPYLERKAVRCVDSQLVNHEEALNAVE